MKAVKKKSVIPVEAGIQDSVKSEVKIRQRGHQFSHDLKQVKNGEVVMVYERDTPVADLLPHRDIRYPGWKRPIHRTAVPGKSFSESVKQSRKEER